MLDLLLTSHRLAAFAVASLILAIVPGPAVIYLMTQTLARGRKAGLASVVGVALGNLMNAAVASLGLAMILSASATAFLLIKMAGAAYLIYLGLRVLVGRKREMSSAQPRVPRSAEMFRDGMLVAFLNPKTALFFAALLPQFVDPNGRSPLLQNLIFGSLFVGIALCTDSLYVITASGLRSAVIGRSSWTRFGRFITAGTFIALGAYAAVASPRSAR